MRVWLCGAQVRYLFSAAPSLSFLGILRTLAAALLVAGCSSRPPPVSVPSTSVVAHRPSPRASPPAIEPVRSHQVATLNVRALGPFVARGPDGGLLAWIARAEKDTADGQDLVVVPVAADGAPLRPARAVARVPREATSLVVESTLAIHGGWLIAWSALLDRGESLTVLGLTAEGSPRGAPVDVERTEDHIKWAKIVPTSRGGLCVWAEETPAGDANVLSAAIDVDGQVRGLPARIARGVAGWQAVRADDGAGLALVAIGAVGDRPAAGTLTWQRLDTEGRPEGSATQLTAKGTVSSDVEVVPMGNGWLMAWTDRTGEDPQVMLAAVDGRGNVRGPTPALDTEGGSSVVALASGRRGVVLAWEHPHARPRAELDLHLATVAEGSLSAQSLSSLEIEPGRRPELVATDSGFALLAPARACLADHAASCAGTVVPTFVRLGAQLNVVQTEPLFLGENGDPAALGWGLRCRELDRCFAFAAPSVTPTPIYAVDLVPRPSRYAAPLPPVQPVDAPHVTGVETIASGQEYDDLAAVRLGTATLVATMTNVLDVPSGEPSGEPSGGKKGRGAKISLDLVDDRGRLLAPARTLTSHALSVGGIALAADGASNPQAAVAWIARQGSAPAVHVALLDQSGGSVRETVLPGAGSDASSVAIAWAGSGWVVAWVDDRDGNGDVYTAKLQKDLTRAAPDHRIRTAPGDASDVALAVGDGIVWVAWSDPRESPREGLSDIFATTLGLDDAGRSAGDVRVLATALHSRSPSLVATRDGGALVAWIEDAPAALDAPGAAMVARLDRAAHVVGAPRALALPEHTRPTEVVLERDADAVRAVVIDASRDGQSVAAFQLADDGSSNTELPDLLDLDAPASFEVALALAGGSMVFSDVGAAPGDHRVRRASVAWKP